MSLREPKSCCLGVLTCLGRWELKLILGFWENFVERGVELAAGLLLVNPILLVEFNYGINFLVCSNMLLKL